MANIYQQSVSNFLKKQSVKPLLTDLVKKPVQRENYNTRNFYRDVVVKSATDFLGGVRDFFIKNPARFGAGFTVPFGSKFQPEGKIAEFLLGKEPIRPISEDIGDIA